jgi:hypothetical protein
MKQNPSLCRLNPIKFAIFFKKTKYYIQNYQWDRTGASLLMPAPDGRSLLVLRPQIIQKTILRSQQQIGLSRCDPNQRIVGLVVQPTRI